MTTREILQLAWTKLRRFHQARKLAGLERDLDTLRTMRDEIHAAESYVQREAMFLRAELKRPV